MLIKVFTRLKFLFLFPFLFFDLLFICLKTNAQVSLEDSVVSITLPQAIKLGLNNSYKLKSVILSIEESNENIKQKKTDRFPEINLGVDAYLINDPILYNTVPFGDPEKVDYTPYQVSGNLMISQVIYSGNRINNSIKQEALQKKLAEYSAIKTTADVKMTVINEYLKLYSLLKDYDINLQSIKQVELRLKTLRSKFSNGQIVKNDVSRSELQKSDFELNLLYTKSNISITNYLLTLLLGLPQNVIIDVDTTAKYAADTLFKYDDCLLAALTNRPEYLQIKTNKEISINQLKIVKGGYYPTINGIGLYGLQNPIPGTFPPQANFLSYLTVGAGLNYNLGSFYKIKNQKSAYKIAIQRDEEDIKNLHLSLSDEVKSQFIQYEMQVKLLDIYEKRILFAAENYRIIQSRYYNDQALISDMVDAEVEYSQARLDLIKGQVQTRKDYYKMLKVIGKL